jgi:hypothetical protein
VFAHLFDPQSPRPKVVLVTVAVALAGCRQPALSSTSPWIAVTVSTSSPTEFDSMQVGHIERHFGGNPSAVFRNVVVGDTLSAVVTIPVLEVRCADPMAMRVGPAHVMYMINHGVVVEADSIVVPDTVWTDARFSPAAHKVCEMVQ